MYVEIGMFRMYEIHPILSYCPNIKHPKLPLDRNCLPIYTQEKPGCGYVHNWMSDDVRFPGDNIDSIPLNSLYELTFKKPHWILAASQMAIVYFKIHVNE